MVHASKFPVDLSFLPRLPKLKRLALPDLGEEADFGYLRSQPALKYIYLTGCSNLKSLDPLRPLTNLRSLSLGSSMLPSGSIEEVVRTWPRLEELQLMGAEWVTSVTSIAGLPLKGLTLNQCPNLDSISPIAKLDRLRWLYLFSTPFRDLGPLKALSNLRIVSLGMHRRST